MSNCLGIKGTTLPSISSMASSSSARWSLRSVTCRCNSMPSAEVDTQVPKRVLKRPACVAAASDRIFAIAGGIPGQHASLQMDPGVIPASFWCPSHHFNRLFRSTFLGTRGSMDQARHQRPANHAKCYWVVQNAPALRLVRQGSFGAGRKLQPALEGAPRRGKT